MAGRHYGMDWLRIGAFGFLIFYHIGMIFVPWDFHVNAVPPVEWLEYPMLALNPWRLSLLFLVSGFASRNLLEKLGRPDSFLMSRTKRLLIPLFFGIFFIVPAQPWVEMVVKYGYSGGFLQFYTQEYFRFGEMHGIVLPTWNHLWFVTYLFVYTILLALPAVILHSRASCMQRAFDRSFSGYGLLLVPVLILFAIRQWLYPVYDESHALVGDWAAHALYGFAFLFGFGLARSAPAWVSIRQHYRLVLAMTIIGGAIFLATARMPDEALGDSLFACARLARSIFAWGMIISLIAIADRYWNHDRPSRMMLVEAVFPFYIIHQTIIVLVYYWLMPLHLHWVADFAVIVLTTVAGCGLFYRIGRKIPGFRMLIGLTGWKPKAP